MAANPKKIQKVNTTEPAKEKAGKPDTDKPEEPGIKGITKVWNDAFAQLNSRLSAAEKDVRDFVKKVEEDGKKRLDALFAALTANETFGEVFGRFKARGEELRADTARLGEETIEKFGLVTRSELNELKEELARFGDLVDIKTELGKVSKSLESLKKKVSGGPTKKALTDLAKRVKALESKAS